MKNFNYLRPSSLEEAIAESIGDRQAMFIAGGTNLVDRMKGFLDQPSLTIDLSGLALNQIETTPDGGLKIGALVTNTDLANNVTVKSDYPILARAI